MSKKKSIRIKSLKRREIFNAGFITIFEIEVKEDLGPIGPPFPPENTNC
jgi:hypothetical protein